MKKSSSVYKEGSRPGAFLISLLLFGLSYGLYHGLQDNFLAEAVGVGKFDRGIVEFFRELPGLLLIFILAILSYFSEEKIYKLGYLIMVIGLFGLSIFNPKFSVVLLFMVVFSLGEHVMMPVRSSISMSIARPGKGGESMGNTSSLQNVGKIAGYLVITILFPLLSKKVGNIKGFKTLFFVAGVIVVFGWLISLRIKAPGKLKSHRTRLYFNKKYNKYYMLEVFYGARKQVFLTFAPYALIMQYNAQVSTISLLMAVCSICGVLFSPLIGKLIDKVGYKTVMICDTLVLLLVCFLYGFAHRLFPPDVAYIVVCVNFVLDSIISLCSMANNLYVKDLSSSNDEVAATLATGISVNHLVSVLIALFGGWIWQTLGIETLFTLSALLGLANTIYAATIKIPKTLRIEE